MSTSILEPQNTPQPSGSAPKAKLHHKARTPQSGKKATPANQGAKTRKLAAAGTRPGSKTAKVLHLLKRSGGATLKDLVKATGWQAHSVRGFLSGTLRKKMGLTVTSTKSVEGERSYAVKA